MGRARRRRAGLEAELQQLDLGPEGAAPTGTGLVSDGGHGDGGPRGGPALQELLQRCVPVKCRPASDEELLLVHSPSFVAQLEPPDSPGPGFRGPRGAVGAALALLEEVLGGALRNGVALLSPQDPQAPPQPAAVAARVAQKRLGVQRVLIVDWSSRPGRDLPQIFLEDPSVLYFGAQRGLEPPPSAGRGPGRGFSVELRWEQAAVTDGDHAAAAFNLLLPISLQFQPQLVLVEASLEDLGGCPSPPALALLTHLLSALARGRLLMLLQGGPDLGASSGGLGAVLRTLLGDPGDPPGPLTPTPSGLASIARTLSVHQRFWGCLQSFETEGEEDEEEEDEEEEAEEEDEEEEDEDEDEEDEEEEEVGGSPPEPPGTARVGLVYDPRMEEHRNTWDSQHPEAPQRLPRVLQRLQELGLAQRCRPVPARPASLRQLRACHTRAHVRALSRCPLLSPRALRALSRRFPSVFLCPRSFGCARLAAGGACAAVGAVLRGQVRSALAVLRPPGHHARRGSAGGFCLFNNAAVAARHGQSLAGSALRVLILDWDIHHGNGTQEIFEEDPSVLYVSLHRGDGSFFPGGPGGSPRRRGRGPGRGFTVNVAWGGPRVGDPEYLAALSRLLLPLAAQFGPELVLVSAGFDAGRGDPLGGCLVSPQTFGLMTHLLGGLAGGRLVLLLEGGYNLSVTAEGVGQCLGVLLGDPPSLPPPGTPQPAALRALGRTLRAQRGCWSCLRLPPGLRRWLFAAGRVRAAGLRWLRHSWRCQLLSG